MRILIKLQVLFLIISLQNSCSGQPKLETDYIYFNNTNCYLIPPNDFIDSRKVEYRLYGKYQKWELGIKKSKYNFSHFEKISSEKSMEQMKRTLVERKEYLKQGYRCLYYEFINNYNMVRHFRLVIDIEGTPRIVQAKVKKENLNEFKDNIVSSINSVYVTKSEEVPDSMNLVFKTSYPNAKFQKTDSLDNFLYQGGNFQVKIINPKNNSDVNSPIFLSDFSELMGEKNYSKPEKEEISKIYDNSFSYWKSKSDTKIGIRGYFHLERRKRIYFEALILSEFEIAENRVIEFIQSLKFQPLIKNKTIDNRVARNND